MIKVYICSPYRADTPEGIQANERKAKRYCKIACKAGYIPIAPHLYFTRFLKDSRPDERELGMQIGIELGQRDEINRKIEAYGDVSPLIAEVNEIDSLIAELEPAPEVNDSIEEKTEPESNPCVDGIDINAIINSEE